MILVSSMAVAASLTTQPPVRVLPAPPTPLIISPPAPPPPPPPLPEPTAQARELALRMLERIPLFEREAHRMVLNQLSGVRGKGSCDRSHPECRRIAEEIADRETPALIREMREGIARVLGAHFDRTMTAAQMAEASRFFADDGARALFASLFSLNERDFAALGPSLGGTVRRRTDLAEEFDRRTRHLPRAVIPVPPAPPAAPPFRRPPAPPLPPPPAPR